MNKPLSELSLKELKKKKTTTELITGILGGLIFAHLIYEGFQYFDTKALGYRHLIFPFLFILVIIYFLSLRQIINEIKSRE